MKDNRRAIPRIITWTRRQGEDSIKRGYLGDVKVTVLQYDHECCCEVSTAPWILSSSIPGLVLRVNRFKTPEEAYAHVEQIVLEWLSRAQLQPGSGSDAT